MNRRFRRRRRRRAPSMSRARRVFGPRTRRGRARDSGTRRRASRRNASRGERGAVARANVRGGEVRAREGKDAEGGERDDAPRVAGAQHGESRCGVEVVEERAIGVVVARESARTPIAISFARVPVAAGEGESRRRGLVRARGSEGVRGGRLLPVDAGDRRVVGTGDVEHLAVLDVKQLHGAVRVAGHEHLTVRSPTQARHGTVGVGRPQLVLALGGGLVPVQPSQGKLPVLTSPAPGDPSSGTTRTRSREPTCSCRGEA